MNPVTALFVTLSTFVQKRVEEAKDSDRGASLIEYGALLALVAAIVAALVALKIPQTVGDYVSDAIASIFGASW